MVAARNGRRCLNFHTSASARSFAELLVRAGSAHKCRWVAGVCLNSRRSSCWTSFLFLGVSTHGYRQRGCVGGAGNRACASLSVWGVKLIMSISKSSLLTRQIRTRALLPFLDITGEFGLDCYAVIDATQRQRARNPCVWLCVTAFSAKDCRAALPHMLSCSHALPPFYLHAYLHRYLHLSRSLALSRSLNLLATSERGLRGKSWMERPFQDGLDKSGTQ